MEAYNVAPTLNWLGGQEWVCSLRRDGSRGWKNGTVIVLEHHGGSVYFVHLATCAGIPRAQITCRIVLREV